MLEACAADASVRAIAGGNGLLYRAVLRVGVACRATLVIAGFRDEVSDTVGYERVAFRLAVGVVADGAYPGGIRHRECAPGLVGDRGSRVAASVRLRQRHPICRVAAGSGGGAPRVIRL